EPPGVSGSSVAILSSDVSEEALKRYDLTPRARIHHLSVLGDDPLWMLTAPIPATRAALKKSGLDLARIDVVELNEAFA
ncbi:acetyl-CoA C-acetyltransferase, partial [Burkholderia cenocepacia]|nr:acetyl-CoA C-acetyltransferase [Burkholderia cenocepacia]